MTKIAKDSKVAADGKTPLRVVRKRLEWVKKQILAHPEKYNQEHWESRQVKVNGNPCSVVGCIAGWLDVKANGMKKHAEHESEKVREIAKALLGEIYTPWLFNGELAERYRPGTKGHAKLDVQGIDRYLKEIEA